MLISLIEIDKLVFEFINTTCSNDFLDGIIPLWRNKYVWIPFYLAVISFLLINFGKKGYWVVLSLLLTAATSDLMSSRIIKPIVSRLRPCNDALQFEEINVLVRCGQGYSFTSSHATNHFAIAIFMILWLGSHHRNWRLFFAVWAFTISLGQVYVGVHYPLDIVGGALLGSIIAIFWFRFYDRHFDNPLHSMS